MGEELTGMLLSLLIILMVLSSTEASRSCLVAGASSSRHASCILRDLTSVPQDLPANIVVLDLSHNRITTFSQSDFSRYGSLREVDLGYNGIATINSQAFHSLPNLIELDLGYNQLSSLTADMVTALGNIEELNLDGNDISNIPTGIFSSTPQLRTLYLRNNKLKKPKSDMFTGPENLETLYLNRNDISDIPTGTFNLTPQLRTLTLGYNKLTNLRSDMFTGLANLETLYLHNNEISDIQTGTFNSTPQLRTLYLRNNKLTNLRSDMFTGLENLESLYLDDNEISDIQAGTFNSTPQLRTLYLHNNNLTNLRSDMFTGLGNLRELRLGRYDRYTWHGLQSDTNEISDIQAGTFNSTPQLQTLSLSHNKLTNLRSDMFTGLGNLETLYLDNNEISDIQAESFNSTPQLRTLYLRNNKLTNLRSDMFTGLGNLRELRLDNNEINDIQAGTFNSTPRLWRLYLEDNRLTVLKAEIFAKLSSLWYVTFDNNPWQCDCRMLPFRQKMTGSHSFENQITCEGPSNFQGQKLKDINPENLPCEEPAIVRFEVAHNNTVVEGETLHLVCEVSGTTPDITVILPSGLAATVESSGRVNVKVNGAITITNVNAADAGLYACVAANPAGSASAILVVNVQWKVPTTGTVAPVMSPLPITGFLNKQSSPSYHESTPTLSIIPFLTASAFSEQPESAPSFSLPILIGSVFASVAGTVLVVIIILTIWCKRKTHIPPSPSTPPVVYSNASAKVTIGGQDQTRQGGDQARSSEHVEVEYADIVLSPSNPETNVARQTQQPAEYQSLGPNRNRAPSDELPPLPPPSNRNNGGATGAHDTPRYYQSLKKKT